MRRSRTDIACSPLLLAAAMLSMAAASAAGHRLNVFAYVRGEQVRVKASFSRDSPARGCQVQVFAPDGRLLHTLQTDDAGECDFSPAAIADLRIVASAGEGHEGEFLLPAEDLAGLTPGEPTAPPPTPPAATRQAASPAGAAASGPAEDGTSASPGDAALAAELARLRRQMERMQDQLAALREPAGVRPQDVINGLCALLGIVGASTLTWYFVQRRRERR